MTTSFKDQCETAANIAGVEVYFYPDSENEMPFEDDGALFVTQDGLRAAFDIGQDCTAAQFNREAKRKTLFLTVNAGLHTLQVNAGQVAAK